MRNAVSLYVVEDDPHIQEFVRRTVALDHGLALRGVSGTRREALKALPGMKVDVLIVDLGLPDGSGIDVIREACLRKAGRSILVFTVLGDESAVIAAIEAGAQGYILKGGEPGELRQAILDVAGGDAPISPSIARHLLKRLRPPQIPRSPDAEELTPREIEVLQLVAQGFIKEEIARRLGIAHLTVATHVRNLYRKLEVHGKAQAVAVAINRRLLRP